MVRALILTLVACGGIEPLPDTNWSPDTALGDTGSDGSDGTTGGTTGGATGGTTGGTTQPTGGSGALTLDAFVEAFVDAYCEAWYACNTSGIECPLYASGTSGDCDFDPVAATECLDGAYACDDSNGAGLELVVPPAACDAVCGAPAR